jgi:hypothetical protein
MRGTMIYWISVGMYYKVYVDWNKSFTRVTRFDGCMDRMW